MKSWNTFTVEEKGHVTREQGDAEMEINQYQLRSSKESKKK